MAGTTIKVTLDQASYQKAMAALSPQRFMERLGEASQQAGTFLLENVKRYPSGPTALDKRAAVDAWTPKQRRWFFWALRTGQIVVPYRRTGILRESWKLRMQTTPHQIQVIVSSDTPYGPYVMGSKQAIIHRARWSKLSKLRKELEPTVNRIFNSAVRNIWAKSWKW